MDKHVVPQPASGGSGEQEVFRGVRTRAVGPAGLLPIASSLSLLWNPCFMGLGMGRQI